MKTKHHILIIEDEKTLRMTLARILQQAGFEVTGVESAEQGIDYLKTTPFDLIFTDLRLPGMAGLEAIKYIRAINASIPVVLFTAQPDLHSAVEALRLGATDYLLKPLKPETIVERAQTILLNHQKEKRKREIALEIEKLQTELKQLENNIEPATQNLAEEKTNERFLKVGSLVLDLHTRRVIIKDETINIPPTSFDYLLVLARHTPNVVNFQTLVAEAQGAKTEAREAQELSKWHIHQLRQAIEQDPHTPSRLITVRGTGYRLVAD